MKKMTFANYLYILLDFLLIAHSFQEIMCIQFDALGHIVAALLKNRHECRTLNEYNALLVPNKQLFSIEVCGIYKLSY